MQPQFFALNPHNHIALHHRFGFQPCHSAAEFHRYIRRFMHNGHGLSDFHPVYEGRVNFHHAVTEPVAAFLESRGVDFQCHTTVTDIIMDPPDKCHRVSAIEWTKANEPKKGTINLSQNDIAIVSLGNIMSGAATGSNTTPPDLELIEIHKDLDENWLLWLELCTKHPKFGNAYNFCTRMLQSRLEVFTVTLRSPEFFNRLVALTGDQPGSVPYVTLKDSTWLLNMSVPRQPFFPDQPPGVQVFWGYAMHPEKTGDFIKKPMINCSGEEIMMELLHHLKFPLDTITCDAITIPCILPRMTSMLLPRVASDRPQITLEGMTNLGLIGQFVEIPNEVVCSTDYGVKGAHMAVHQLMGLEEQQPVKASKSKKSSVFGLSRFL